MKRGFGEEDLSELLQCLDDEAEDPSNDGDNLWEPELEPKHKIFLSHSGVQKNFTEQLCIDLERWEYAPFFDKRPDSLPKGKKFPELIFQAAQQCYVAILMLSEDFFTRTKWPMLELEAFVQSQKTNPGKLAILPVYLGLSRNECTRNETRRLHWLSVWREWAKHDGRIDVDKWEDALKVLEPSNGIEYMEFLGEVALREKIVSAVRCLIQPESSWSAAHVQGRARICKAIIKKFVSTKPTRLYGVRVVGVYGMGGIGKTTFCKVLCDELYMKFQGKVCHAELGSKSPIELQKEVLRRLTDINHDSLAFKTEDMTIDLLRRRIRQQQVFLALDNVWQESLEETKVYLRTGFHHGSIVMVTARSIDILGRLNIDGSNCLEMPDLEVEDARKLFLHSAAPHIQFLSESDEPNIQCCINQCRFHKGVNIDEHFHPLALKVLGAQLGSLGCNPSIWVESLSKDDKFNQFREEVHPIFNILRRGYDSLCKDDQLLFMDVVLFYPSPLQDIFIYEYPKFVTSNKKRDYIFCLDIYEWLRIVHNLSEVRYIKDRLQALKAKSLLEDIGDGFSGVSVHDLYLDFAKFEAKRGDLNVRCWVWYDKEATYPFDLVSRPSGNCWSNVKRVSTKYDVYTKLIHWNGVVEGIRWQHFYNVVVLELLIGWNEVLDVRGLLCLRSMELTWDGNSYDYKGGGQIVGLGELRNLEWLHLRNIHSAPCFQEMGQLTMLQVLQFETTSSFNYFCQHLQPLEPPNLDKCIQLREIVLQCPFLMSFPDLSRLTSLRKVFFKENKNAREVVGLGSQMSSLRELLILDCHSLSQCHGLGDVVSLQELHFEGYSEFTYLPDLHKLTNLRRLNILGIKVKEVLGLNDSMLLQELRVREVEELPNLHLLRHLQRLFIRRVKHMMLWFDSFIALEELILDNLSEVRDLYGMDKLSRLRRLTITGAPNLLRLPMLGGLMALQHLELAGCCELVGNAELPDLENLTKLEFLGLGGTPIRSLPPLKRLTQLRELRCVGTLLAELPVLQGLDKLERIDLAKCRELTSLDKVGPMPTVLFLDVSTCYNLERLPDLRNSKSLEYLSFCHTGVRLFPEDLTTLATLPALRMFGWDHLEVRFSELLEKMSLAEAVLHVERKQLEYFTTLQTKTWIDPDTFPEKGRYYRHPFHACMHNAYIMPE